MTGDPRKTALDILLFWQSKQSITLDKSLEKYGHDLSILSKKDRGFCNALVFGTLRHREFIDWIISHYSNTSINKIHQTLLYILRLGLFQIIYMDRVPDFAAINTSVEIAKKLRGKKAAGFINAILRKAIKEYSKIAFPDKQKKFSKHISVKYSIPSWLTKRWTKTYGADQTEIICKQIYEIPSITLRVNTLKTDRQALSTQIENQVKNIALTQHSPAGIRFTNPSLPIQDMDLFKNGAFQIQDEAAQIVTAFLSPQPDEKVLDACAGLGGKTGHIAQLMENKGIIVATDSEPKKLESLSQDAVRLGIDIIQTKPVDILKTTIKDFDFYFDRVLIDAPCTGLGVLRRNPDAKWKRTTKDITRLAAKQKKMLNAAANLVRPGGILVFAVCSCEKEENEDIVHSFLQKRKDFSIDKQIESDTYSSLVSKEGFLKTYPPASNNTDDMDGFFAARLIRKKPPEKDNT